MNKTIKKIVALGMGATMLAGTAAMALATDLSNYPAPFVKDGVFVGKIVIGEKAYAIDTVGALDVAASLQRASTTVVSTSGSSTSVEGGYRLDTSGNRIYYGEAFSVDSVTKDNLNLMSDKQFEDNEGTVYDYSQSVVFAKTQNLAFSQHSQSSADSFLAFDMASTTATTSDYLFQAKVDFNKAVNTTKASIIGQKIVLFGKEYTFSSESTGNKLVLFGSSEQVSLTPKDEATKTINGKEFVVKVIGFASTASKVTLSVNGETDSVTEGTSKTIGGLKIYAKSVSSWNNGIDGFATLQLGAEKLVLEHGKKVATGNSEDSVQGTLVQMSSSVATPNLIHGLTSLQVYVTSSDSSKKYLAEGGSFNDPVFGTFAIKYIDTANSALAGADTVIVRPAGSTRVYANVPVSTSEKQDVYFSYNGALQYDQNRDILPVEGSAANQDDYLYLSPNTNTDMKYTHLVKVSDVTLDATNGYARFEDAVKPGTYYDTVKGGFVNVGDNRSLTVDGKAYNVQLMSNSTTASNNVSVTYSDSQTVVFPLIELASGEKFTFLANLTGLSIPNATSVLFPSGAAATLTTVAAGAGYSVTIGGVNYTYTNTTAGVINSIGIATVGGSAPSLPGVLIREEKDNSNVENLVFVGSTYVAGTGVDGPSAVLFTGTNSAIQSMKDTYTNSYMDFFGTYVTKYNPSGNNDVEVKVMYPQDQMYANVFISPTAAKATSTSTSGAVSLNPISVGLAILDTDAKLGGTTPYIVIGGPCANTVAATLMGNPEKCYEGWTEGKATIKLFSTQNALLVAGATGKDTQGACRVLANYDTPKYALSGMEVEVVTASLSDLSVKKVSS
jgi:hypothetical protein